MFCPTCCLIGCYLTINRTSPYQFIIRESRSIGRSLLPFVWLLVLLLVEVVGAIFIIVPIHNPGVQSDRTLIAALRLAPCTSAGRGRRRSPGACCRLNASAMSLCSEGRWPQAYRQPPRTRRQASSRLIRPSAADPFSESARFKLDKLSPNTASPLALCSSP